MKFHAFHFTWLGWFNDECVIIVGFAGGRADCSPEAKWIYSFRIFLGLFKIEIVWLTGAK